MKFSQSKRWKHDEIKFACVGQLVFYNLNYDGNINLLK